MYCIRSFPIANFTSALLIYREIWVKYRCRFISLFQNRKFYMDQEICRVSESDLGKLFDCCLFHHSGFWYCSKFLRLQLISDIRDERALINFIDLILIPIFGNRAAGGFCYCYVLLLSRYLFEIRLGLETYFKKLKILGEGFLNFQSSSSKPGASPMREFNIHFVGCINLFLTCSFTSCEQVGKNVYGSGKKLKISGSIECCNLL